MSLRHVPVWLLLAAAACGPKKTTSAPPEEATPAEDVDLAEQGEADAAAGDDASADAATEAPPTSEACAVKADHVHEVTLSSNDWRIEHLVEPQVYHGEFKTVTTGRALLDGYFSDVAPNQKVGIVLHFSEPLLSHAGIGVKDLSFKLVGEGSSVLRPGKGVDGQVKVGGELPVKQREYGIHGDRLSYELTGFWAELGAEEVPRGTRVDCLSFTFRVPTAYDDGYPLPGPGTLPVQHIEWTASTRGKYPDDHLFGPSL